MSKHKKRESFELDDEFFAQLDFLRQDHNEALEEGVKFSVSMGKNLL